jgi:hypothetical protein
VLKVGKSLSSTTKKIVHVTSDPAHHKKKVIFVDTPPFPNPNKTLPVSEREFEKNVTTWLRKNKWVMAFMCTYSIDKNGAD